MKLTWRGAVAALVLIGGMAWAQDAPAQPAESPAMASSASGKTAPDKTTMPMPKSAAGPDYVIGPDDVLHVAVWKEADLSATLPVRPDGKISLPLLNDVQASGLTPEQLGGVVTEKLRKYIADPHVTVVVATINSKRIYLVGEVLRPGAATMLPNMTVLQALSSAGINAYAKTKGIYVLRTENGKQQKLPVNYRRLVKGDLAQNYELQPGDTIVVP
ncbi:MAG: polysaccharide biosynthesis/export family protein [Terriglobales bacterium]